MATRPQGTKFKKGGGVGVGNNNLVMTGIGNIYSFFISWRGVTAGDRLLIHDGTDSTGAVIEEVIFSNANSDGINVQMPAVGKEFGTGLYINVSGITGGEVDWSVGFDGNG